MSGAWFKRLVKSRAAQLQFGAEAQITVAGALPPTDRLTTSSAQIFVKPVFDCPVFTLRSPISARAFGTSSPNQDIRF